MKKFSIFVLSILFSEKIFTQDFYIPSPEGLGLRSSTPCTVPAHINSDSDNDSNLSENDPVLDNFDLHGDLSHFTPAPSIIFVNNTLLNSSSLSAHNIVGTSLETTHTRFDACTIISNFRLNLAEKIMLLHAVGQGIVYLRNDQPLCTHFQSQYIVWKDITNASQLRGVKFVILTSKNGSNQKNEIKHFLSVHPQITPIFAISDPKIWRQLSCTLKGIQNVVYTPKEEIIYVNITWVNS
jgi:hypothetical protein